MRYLIETYERIERAFVIEAESEEQAIDDLFNDQSKGELYKLYTEGLQLYDCSEIMPKDTKKLSLNQVIIDENLLKKDTPIKWVSDDMRGNF